MLRVKLHRQVSFAGTGGMGERFSFGKMVGVTFSARRDIGAKVSAMLGIANWMAAGSGRYTMTFAAIVRRRKFGCAQVGVTVSKWQLTLEQVPRSGVLLWGNGLSLLYEAPPVAGEPFMLVDISMLPFR